MLAYQPDWESPPGTADASGHRRPKLPASRSQTGIQTGIQPGMPLAEALTLHEFFVLRQAGRAGEPAELHLEAHDPAADRLALAGWAAECQRFSPTVGLEEGRRPDCLLLDVTGLAGLFGGEPALARQVAEWFAERGFTARVVLADTVGAAWAVAHYATSLNEQFQNEVSQAAASPDAQWFSIVPPGAAAGLVAGLPIAALRLPEPTRVLLGQLGIERIGALCRLPRKPALPFRTATGAAAGSGLRHAARGDPGRAPAPELAAEWLLEHATERRDVIEAVWRQLLPRVVEPLAAQGKGVLELTCRLDCQAGEPWCWSLGLFRASAFGRTFVRHAPLAAGADPASRPISAVPA